MRRLSWAWWLLASLLGACQRESDDGGLPLRYRPDDFDGRPFVFLVAGSRENANFPQEIIDQERIWRAMGVRPESLACYYLQPSDAQFRVDASQWERLAPSLRRCYQTSVPRLRKHLALAATKGHPLVYLYFTGHGLSPIAQEFWLNRSSWLQWRMFRLSLQYPILHHYHLVVDAPHEGDQMGSFADQLDRNFSGTPSRELFLTPGFLREMLEAFPVSSEKVVVLQACFSGGFVRMGRLAGELSRVPRVRVITSARFDRQSFGVEPEEPATFFGAAYNAALRSHLSPDPASTDWAAVYQAAKARVESTEVLRYGDGVELSLPVYFDGNAP